MTDNEKRAHDLAIAMIPEIGKLKTESAIASGEKSIHIDYFEEYMSAYELSLAAFRKRFPDAG